MKFTYAQISRLISRIKSAVRPPKSYKGKLTEYRGEWVAKIRLRKKSDVLYPGDFVTLRNLKGKKMKVRLKMMVTEWDEYGELPPDPLFLPHDDDSNKHSSHVALWTFIEAYEVFMESWIRHLSGLIIQRKGAGRKMVVSELMKRGNYTRSQSKEILRIIEWLMMEVHHVYYSRDNLPMHVKSRRGW